MTATPLDRKLAEVFPGRVLAKSLSRRQVFHRVPRYVVEYLLAKYAPDGDEPRVQKVQQLLQERYPGPEQREWVKDRLLRDGKFVLIDELEVQVDLGSGRHTARVPSLGDLRVDVPFELPERFPGVLHGLWGTIGLAYDAADRRIRVEDFVPFQVERVDLAAFQAARGRFSDDEWVELLLRSVGLEPRGMSRRLRLLYLARLTPLVEPGLHLMELGPRQTGKTFLLRNTTPRAFVISGGRATPATLFYHQTQRRPGLIPTQDAVVFDEVAHTRWDDPALLSSLKDYLESGRFSRGSREFHAQASVLFLGNCDRPDHPRTRVLPDGLRGDTAFLDRIAGLLPGFEFPKVTPSLLTEGCGLVVDYLAEVLRKLRALSFEPPVAPFMPPGYTQRDLRGVQKITSGLLKLAFPGRGWSKEALEEVARLAVELREGIYAELSAWNPGEFPPRAPTAAAVSPVVIDIQAPNPTGSDWSVALSLLESRWRALAEGLRDLGVPAPDHVHRDPLDGGRASEDILLAWDNAGHPVALVDGASDLLGDNAVTAAPTTAPLEVRAGLVAAFNRS